METPVTAKDSLRRYSIKSAARLSKCSTSTIPRLVKTEKIQGAKVGRSYVVLAGSPGELVADILKHVARHGYKRRDYRSNGEETVPSSGATVIEDLKVWLSIPKDKRKALLALGAKYDRATLTLFLTLGD